LYKKYCYFNATGLWRGGGGGGGGIGSPGIIFLHLHYASCVYDPIKPILGQFEGNLLSFHKKKSLWKEAMLVFFLLYGGLWKCFWWNLNEAILYNSWVHMNAIELVVERWKLFLNFECQWISYIFMFLKRFVLYSLRYVYN
jgi:hypothetical protein